MNLVEQNPFRVAGILASSSAREIERQKSKIARFTSVGKDIESEVDYDILPAIVRDENSSSEAFAKIEQNKGKLDHALFWFAENGPIDSTALENLAAGNSDKAQEIWTKATDGKEVSANNYSFFSNLGTLLLCKSDLESIKQGIALKFKLIDSPHFKDFIALVADANYQVKSNDQISQTIEGITKNYGSHPDLAGKNPMDLFSFCPASILSSVSSKITEDPVNNIENLIDTAKRERKKEPSKGYEAGLQLYKNSAPELLALRSLLSSENVQFKLVADKLAKEILQCGIDYFKAKNEHANPAENAIELMTYAKEIALSEQVLDRIKENLEGIREWRVGQPTAEEREAVEEDYNALTAALNAHIGKKASLDAVVTLIRTCRDHLTVLKEKLGETNEFYLSMTSAVANVALNMVIEVVNAEQNKLKTDHSRLNPLSDVVNRSVKIISALTKLELNSDTKKRIDENRKTINGIKSQLDTAKSRKSGSDAVNVIRVIFGLIALMFVLARACH